MGIPEHGHEEYGGTEYEAKWEKYAHRPGARLFRMAPGAMALSLCLKYLCLMAYSITALVFHIPSFVEVGGSLFAVSWAAVILVFASFALAALARTWYTGKYRLEKWATAGLVLMFLVYSVVIVVRIGLQGAWSGVGVFWLPIALAVLPTIHYYSLSVRHKT